MGASQLYSGSLGAALSSDFAAISRRLGRGAPKGRVAPAQPDRLSQWVRSGAKRLFDAVCVLGLLPIALPLALLIALAVRATSHGPALFRQQRMGRGGRVFTVFKFRTMPVAQPGTARTGLTTTNNQGFTPIGPFLRHWKLDELPQLANVLLGDMSLVGPRPKLPCYETGHLPCRPGLTGFATVVFAREERAMALLPIAEVEAYYLAIVKPFKQRLDADYMARATLFSDLELILRSVFRRWNDVALTALPPWTTKLTPELHGVTAVTANPAMLDPEQAFEQALAEPMY